MNNNAYDKAQAFLRIWLPPVSVIVPVVLLAVHAPAEAVGSVSAVLAAIATGFGLKLNAASKQYNDKKDAE